MTFRAVCNAKTLWHFSAVGQPNLGRITFFAVSFFDRFDDEIASFNAVDVRFALENLFKAARLVRQPIMLFLGVVGIYSCPCSLFCYIFRNNKAALILSIRRIISAGHTTVICCAKIVGFVCPCVKRTGIVQFKIHRIYPSI